MLSNGLVRRGRSGDLGEIPGGLRGKILPSCIQEGFWSSTGLAAPTTCAPSRNRSGSSRPHRVGASARSHSQGTFTRMDGKRIGRYFRDVGYGYPW